MKEVKMKQLKIIVFIVGLVAIYAIALFVPTVTVQAIYESQTASVNYTLFEGLLHKSIVKGSILFTFDYNTFHIFIIFCSITLATVFVSLKKGRIIGVCFYFIAFIFLSFNANVTVFSQILQNESHEIHEKPSLFLIIFLCVSFIFYFVQGIILKKERLSRGSL